MSEPTVSRPIIGDPGYLEALDRAHAAGHVTDRERRQRRLVHLHLRRVRHGRPQPGDGDFLWYLSVEYAAGRLTVAEGEELLREHDRVVSWIDDEKGDL
jgi:hypothetical protein